MFFAVELVGTAFFQAIIWRALLAGRKFAMLDAASMPGASRKLSFTIRWSMNCHWGPRPRPDPQPFFSQLPPKEAGAKNLKLPPKK